MIAIMVVAILAGGAWGAMEAAHVRRRRDFNRRLSRWYDDERICRDVDH